MPSWRAGGALSHHHGVGLNRSRFVAEALGPAFDVLVATKAALDPNGILNPGKLGLPSALRTVRLLMSILVIDVGTSGLRAAVVRPDATIAVEQHRELLPDTPAPGLVEFDATRMAEVALEVARAVLAEGGPVDAVGIANQRASTIVWDRGDRRAGGPGARLAGPAHDRHVPRAPGRRARRGAQRVGHQGRPPARRGRSRPVARPLRRHRRHLAGVAPLRGRARTSPTPPTPASPGCSAATARDWDDRMLDALRIDRASLPDRRRLERGPRPGHRARRARRRSPRSSATSRRR